MLIFLCVLFSLKEGKFQEDKNLVPLVHHCNPCALCDERSHSMFGSMNDCYTYLQVETREKAGDVLRVHGQ